jgi:hypothetical protein
MEGKDGLADDEAFAEEEGLAEDEVFTEEVVGWVVVFVW